MNISTTEYVSSTQNSSYTTNTSSSSSNNSVSFKDELVSVNKSKATEKSEKESESKINDEKKVEGDEKTDKTVEDSDVQKKNDEVNAEKTSVKESKDAKSAKNVAELKNAKSANEKDSLETVKALNSKIEAMKALQNQQKTVTTGVSKVSKKSTDLSKNSLKMDLNDAKFFVNLVQNQQFTVQNNPNVQVANGLNGTEAILKNEATQQAVNVSSALMTQLQESMATNKPFRIDFDNNVAVVMHVDKDGKLSANFIPGDKAVEAYLKANLPALQQSFDAQNLPYNKLTYKHARQDNSDNNGGFNNSRKHKEDTDE